MEMFLAPLPMVIYFTAYSFCESVFSSYNDNFNKRNPFLTAKLLKQDYRYHTIRKAFSKFYHGHSELIVERNIGVKILLLQGISEPIFYGDSFYEFKKKNVGKPNFSDRF